MRAVLILSEAVILIGSNETFVGDITGGDSTEVVWTVVFSGNGTYDLRVKATAQDSNGAEASSSQSVTVLVVPEFPSLLILPLFIIATLVAVAVYRRSLRSDRSIILSVYQRVDPACLFVWSNAVKKLIDRHAAEFSKQRRSGLLNYNSCSC